MLGHASHAALKDAEHPFDGVRADIATHGLVYRVIADLVADELLTDLAELLMFVGHEPRITGDMILKCSFAKLVTTTERTSPSRRTREGTVFL